MKIYRLLIIVLTLILCSCGGAKYTYSFEKGKNIHFNNGKWILNEPFTNYEDRDAYEFSKEEFHKILGDSLLDLTELRKTKIIKKQLPLNPTRSELEEIKKYSQCDYLINIHSEIIKDEMGSSSMSTPNIGTVTKYNDAKTKIIIYDLNKLELISETTAFGQVKVTKKADDDESVLESLIKYTTPGRILALQSIKKLIGKYNKNKLD
ncbi:hypothetical protein SAMN04487764_2813 [Gillisia sp. Hel1_33_143]|uniref:hypothetical protein n=1 Tax=Gillisia sp. Hel1_33_143 TaxID=1336796 RepID=UPI00087C3EF8|nr:hypothetical protein [Gillisia sp. Hel1_33_143]SDS69220.1 hypothetical protein SAMN04487764_2813 [Gillisia sp. Hel1_33_143]